MIALAPLGKLSFQVIVGLSGQARNGADPLCTGPVAGNAGGNIGGRTTASIEGFSGWCETTIAITCRLRTERREVSCQSMGLLRSEVGRGGPHVLLGKGIVAAVNVEASQLGLDVGGPLASKLGCGRVALPRRPVAPSAIAVGE